MARRNRWITLRCSEQEYSRIKENAAKSRMNRSAYIRRRAMFYPEDTNYKASIREVRQHE